MEFDRTLLTDNYLINVITCIEKNGLDVEDFEFYTQRTNSYKQGYLDPKAIVYAHRVSTGVEISYILDEGCDFSAVFADDLQAGLFEKI